MSRVTTSRSSSNSTIRFAVGTPEGPRGSVWRLWTRGDDVYISHRWLTKVKKVSLHKSGHWRHAFTKDHVRKGSPFVSPGQDRATDKWERPSDLLPGINRAFDVVVPASEIVLPRQSQTDALNDKKKIVWLPSAPDGYATYFTVVFTTAEVTAATSGWPGRRGMGSRLIWRAELPNGQTVWLVASELPVDDWLRQVLAGFKRSVVPEGQRKMEEAGYTDLEEGRGLIYGRDDQTGLRWYIDVSANITDKHRCT